MANPEHVARLHDGVHSWNAWWTEQERHNNDRADLRGADLRRASLGGANLFGANLHSSNLSDAYLVEANLYGATLTSAALNRASLNNANLAAANLDHASLHKTILYLANLSTASLQETDFRNANLGGTIFADVDLSAAINLDTCDHFGPSTVDQRTLHKSALLPEAFLRGCGLSGALLAQALRHENCVTLEFRRAVWSQLIPIEWALARTIGDRFRIVEKRSDGLVVSFDSTEDLQLGLDSIIAVLASMDRELPGETNALVVHRRNDEERLEAPDLRELLLHLVNLLEQNVSKPPLEDEARREVAALVPGGALAELLVRRRREIPEVFRTTYSSFRAFFGAVRRVHQLSVAESNRLDDGSREGGGES